MAWRRSVVYAVVLNDKSLQFRYSPRPAIDAAWLHRQGAKRMTPLHPPLPPAWADVACRHLQAQVEVAFRGPGMSERKRRRWALIGRRRRDPIAQRVDADVRRFAARTRRSFGMVGYRWSAHVQDAIPLQDTEPNRGSGTQDSAGLQPCAAESPDALRTDESPGTGVSLGSGVSPGSKASLGSGMPPHAGTPADLLKWPAADDLNAVAELMEGRLLGELEALQLVERSGIDLHSSVDDCLAALTLTGRLQRRPGLQRTSFGDWRCLRCGATQGLVPWDCAACGDSECWICEECRALGVMRACTLLHAGVGLGAGVDVPIGASAAALSMDPVPFHSHDLTPAQARAADALEQFVAADERREALVWAVCGAGKTELCFPAVARVLGSGGRVLFAIPRRDVVQEIGQRLRAAFPGVDMQVLHGGSGRTELWKLGQGTITVATTHQVLRFERAFDLVVLDEVDAFPYRGSRMLQQAVENAVRRDGRIVRMSATPDRNLITRADAGDSLLITVPARHHGRPLPVPVLQRDATLARREGSFRPSALLHSQIELSLHGLSSLHGVSRTDATQPTRVLIFVPDVASTERVGRALAKELAPARRLAGRSAGRGRDVGRNARPRVLWSHARDPEREAKIRALQQGSCEIFVATSILERGITVPDVDVIVLFADNERVFSESTLVQMAGRVGRTVERPMGRVQFIGGRIGPAMRRAVQQIERLNEEAARLGLLRRDDAIPQREQTRESEPIEHTSVLG